LFTQGQEIAIAGEELVEGAGSLGVIIHIGSGALVGVVREAHEGSGGVRACNCPRVHFSKNHTGWFNEAEGGVDSEEFAGRAGAESVGIVHAEAIRDPIILISRELSEFVGAVCSGREGFLQLVVRSPVIPTYPKTTVLDINIFEGVGGGGGCGTDNVGAGGWRRFWLGVEAARKHLGGPSRENGGGTGAPFRYGDTNVFPIRFEI
jgi:hypothetical protein